MMANLGVNIAYNFVYQLLILLLPLVTAPYLARVVGAGGLGMYSYSYAVATYFVYAAMLGLNNYGNREIASCQGRRGAVSRMFWSIYAMQVVCFLVAATAYACYAVFISSDRRVALLQGIYVLSSLFDINWLFFGLEQFKLTVIRNVVVKGATTISIFVFVRSATDILVYVGIMAAGFLLSQLCLWPFLPRMVDFARPRLRDIGRHLLPNLVLFIPVVAVSIYNILGKILLGSMAGPEAVGYFESAVKVIAVPVALVAAVGIVMLPRSSALVAQGNGALSRQYADKTLVVVMAFTALAGFGLPAIALPFTEVFYGPGFEPTAYAMMVLSATVPLLGFGNVVRSQYLLPNSRDRVFLWSAVCGAVVSVVVNLALIPVLGVLGAAIASVCAEAAVLLCQAISIRREVPIARYMRIASSFCALGSTMLLVLRCLPTFEDNIADILVNSVVGAVVYGVIGVPLLLRFMRTRLLHEGQS